MFLPLVAEFIYTCNDFQEVDPLSTVHTIYYDISEYLTIDRGGRGWSTEGFLKIKADSFDLKKAIIKNFPESMIITSTYSSLSFLIML